MKTQVDCPRCKVPCKKVFEKTTPTSKDMLFLCWVCKSVIAVRVTKTENSHLW